MESLVHGMLSNAAAVTVLAVVIALAGRLGRRPALIHSLCLLAMLKLVTPPIMSLPLPMPPLPVATTQPAASPEPVLPDDGDFLFDVADAGPAESLAFPDDLGGDWPSDEPVRVDGAENPASPVARSWEIIALGFMLAGALAWWTLAAVRIARFHRLLHDVEPMPAGWRDEAAELAARLGLRRPPTTYLVPGDLPPMLWALGPRVRLLVPARLWTTLTDDERTSLLLHELAHLRRRDHWVRWAELMVAGLYWWHPAVWWIGRALREAEEQCCDAWVVWAMPGGARTYAAALVAALEFVSGARTAPAAAASATLGSGHVSSLKRRLRMIVRAKTPKGLSWAGRLAVACLSALLLPLAPSWGQKEDGKKTEPPPARFDAVAAATGKLIETDMQLIDAQAALDVAKDRLVRTQAGERTPLEDAQLEARIEEEFKKDPDVQPLIDEINEAMKSLHGARRKARQPKDAAVVHAERQHGELLKQWQELWKQKHDEIKERVQAAGQADDFRPTVWRAKVANLETAIDQLKKRRSGLREMVVALKVQEKDDAKPRKGDDDEPKQAKKGEGEPKKESRSREASERIEKELKELKEKLGKDLDPVGDAVRKSLEKALDEIQQALKKEGMTPDDLRRAVERSRNELHKSLQRGGPVEKQMREAAERARKDMQEAMKRSMQDAGEYGEAMKGRMHEMREQKKKRHEDMAEAHRKAAEQQRKAMEAARAEQRKAMEERHAQMRRSLEQQRESARARSRREQEERAEPHGNVERPRAEETPKADDREKAEPREDMESARREIRALQERLREANRRLERLQRRESRRPEPPARPATPATPARPAEPRQAEAPAQPAQPRQPAQPAQPPQPERARGGDDYERRFRDLEDKMDRLLRQLEQMRREPAPGTRASLSR